MVKRIDGRKKKNESYGFYDEQDMLDCVSNILNYVDNLSDELNKQGNLVPIEKISNTLQAIGAYAYSIKRILKKTI